jgi:ATP-dependent DNA helicase RecG
METIYSGAQLSELDLKLRGHGDLYGTAQSGTPKLKIASFGDTLLIQQTKHTADEIFPLLSDYPQLLKKVESITIKKVSPD